MIKTQWMIASNVFSWTKLSTTPLEKISMHGNTTIVYKIFWHQAIYLKQPSRLMEALLTHWGRVTHICVSKLTIIGSDNGLSPERRQATIWTNAGIVLIGPLGTNFSEILIDIQSFSFKKMHLKMSPGKWRPFGLGFNVLTFLCWYSRKCHWCYQLILPSCTEPSISLSSKRKDFNYQFHVHTENWKYKYL